MADTKRAGGKDPITYNYGWLKGLPPIETRILLEPKPKPFPGRHPLRIAVRITYDTKGDKQKKPTIFTYFGKPSLNLLQKVQSFLQNPSLYGTIYVGEFDRGGRIAEASRAFPNSDPFAISNWWAELFRYYHAITWTNGQVLSWVADRKIGPLTLRFRGKEFVVYSLAHWTNSWKEKHKIWLEGSALTRS